MNDDDLTILHVEDDDLLADIVNMAFKNFGFRGQMISAKSVSAATRLLNDRAKDGKAVNLILSDMRLPDGSALDLIRELKADPAHRFMPIVVLSHDLNKRVVKNAYALGASSYLAKGGAGSSLLVVLQHLYSHWIEDAVLPGPAGQDRLHDVLERSISLRIRTSEFYLRLAGEFKDAPEEMEFWLDRTMHEGNLANLLAFFRNRLREQDVSPETIKKLAGMQSGVQEALRSAEECLRASSDASSTLAYALAIQVATALDEEVFAEVLGILFPVSAVATRALKARAADQMRTLAWHIRERVSDQVLLQKADSLLSFSERIESEYAT